MQNLRSDIENNRLQVVYQPIYCTNTNKYVSAEALSRIYNADGEMYNISEAVRYAETNGFIDLLFFKVIDTVVNDGSLERFQAISINLSPFQLREKAYADMICDFLENKKVNPNKIIFELTENWDQTCPEELVKNIETFKNKGYSIAIDDYYTGGTRHYIKMLPFDIIKLDKSIIHCGYSLKKTLKRLHNNLDGLGVKVIVEGVETTQQEKILLDCGYSWFQGYLYSKPEPILNFS